MSNFSTISSVHIKKLDHEIDEIRLRALDNVISKFNLGFQCDCNAVRKELLVKLLKWFSMEAIGDEDKVLDLLIMLLKSDSNYLNSFGKLRFQNELRDLRTKLDSQWHDKLNLLEEIVANPRKFLPNFDEEPEIIYENLSVNSHRCKNASAESTSLPILSPLDSSVPFELTMNYENSTIISKKSDNSIKWLGMPWQVLVSSDKGIISQVEDSLNESDIKSKIKSCQFITNILLQDFPAEVFLQRPMAFNILLGLLQIHKNDLDQDSQTLIITILKTFHKLTRSLRFRIYYYCDPSIAHKAQKILARILESEHSELLGRDSPEGEPPDHDHLQYERNRVNNKNPYSIDEEDDTVLQMQQIFIPNYCSETLLSVLKLLSTPSDPIRPLKIIRHISELVYELVQLFITSVMPTIWFCSDNLALKIQENIRILLEVFSEILDYFGQFNSVDYFRITYLYFLWTVVKLISNLVPLELADQVIPKKMKLSICAAIMDAPIFIMYPDLNITLQEYARKFRGTQESDTVKLLDETRMISKSIKAAISLIKHTKELSYSEELKTIYSSKLSLPCHRNFKIIKRFIKLAQNTAGYKLSSEDKEMTEKMLLTLLANSDNEIQEFTYSECHNLVTAILRTDCTGQYSWKNLLFLMESSILTEIICHGRTSENENIKKMSDDILLFLLEGKLQLTGPGWSKFLEVLIPVLPLLQCFAKSTTPLGKSISKILDPDVSSNMKLPFVEVLKGNIRSLFSPVIDIRDESLCRLHWLLSQEKNSSQKLPHLSHCNLPLGSICIFNKKISIKRFEGTYQKNSLFSLLDLLRSEVDPKIRKSALIQVQVMLTDSSLHEPFITEQGLPLVLDIFSKALIDKEYTNYPDSVVPIVSILKILASSQCSIRHELSHRIDIYYNVLRSMFLYPNNENIRMDGAQLLVLLLFDDYILTLTEKSVDNLFDISLPYLITIKMKLPFTCKVHWRTSIHRRTDISVFYNNNTVALSFIRQLWAWEWHGGEKLLRKNLKDVNDLMLNANLIIKENEFDCITFTSLHFCLQQQLYNIQNASTHNGVSKGIDYITMYLRLGHLLNYENFEKVLRLSWSNTFERFLQSHPTNKEDHDLLANVLNFLHLYIKLTNGEESMWLHKAVKSMIRSLTDWLPRSEIVNDDLHQSVLRLARACSILDPDESDRSKNSWICFVEFAVANLVIGEYYNLAFLDWTLSTLTVVIGKCNWANNKSTLMAMGNTLIEMILSFYREGTVSFMGLAITRDCIICLNHALHQMQINLNNSLWTKFWYDQSQSLSWLPTLWKSRDPLVRASALQLLASLINGPHTALQLLNAIDLSPGELCLSLLYFITTQEESCIVKEEACLVMSNLIKNSNSIAFQYIDSLKPSAMLTYVKENNVYHEIAVMSTNLYTLATLDPELSKCSEPEGAQTQSLASLRTASSLSVVPKTIYHLYNCDDDIQKCSAVSSEITNDDDLMQFITTPSLMTSLCLLLNNLISIGEQEVIHEIFEHSLHKYIIECFGDIPRSISGESNLEHYCNILEMYTSLCTVLTNCIIHSPDFASIVVFSADFIQLLFELLNKNLYFDHTPRLVQLYDRLATEIFKFLACLSLTEHQHFDSIQTALEKCDTESFLKTVCDIIKNSKSDLGISALSFLTFLLSQEMQKDCEDNKVTLLKEVLDNKLSIQSVDSSSNDLNRPSTKSAQCLSSIENPVDRNIDYVTVEAVPIGADICKTLIDLFVAHNHTKLLKKCKQTNDKEIIAVTLTNLLCISVEAKKFALETNFPSTTLLVLKEIYVKLSGIPIQATRSQVDLNQKINPLLQDIDSIYVLLMNFMYDSEEAKEVYAKAGLADIIHKLWTHSSQDKKLLIATLKLLSTFTSNCKEASKSLSLTTVTPGVGLKKTPNSISLIHVIVQLVTKEIDMINRQCDCTKLNYAFYVLRNAIHNHECRVVISKSNLLQFFSKIHPLTTKRTKLSQIIEINCLEFLIDFTYYDEGQLSVSKAVDSLEVLINLARISSGHTRLLAISILRNLAFNISNRPRLLASTEFLDLLLSSLKNGTITDIEIAGSTLWSLVSNNQKGKLIARSAGFLQAMQTAISRLSLLPADDVPQRELIKMLEYVQQIINPR